MGIDEMSEGARGAKGAGAKSLRAEAPPALDGARAGAAAVFLDRDGTLNRAVVRDGKPFPPGSLDEFQLLPEVPSALRRLKDAGFALVVVSNQPDVARGLQRREVVEKTNARLAALLPLDEMRVCYHDDGDDCECRKPRPGLLTQAPHYDMSRSYMIGDRWRDIEAGRRAGCSAVILIDHDYQEPLTMEPDLRVQSVAEAVDWILKQSAKGAKGANGTNATD